MNSSRIPSRSLDILDGFLLEDSMPRIDSNHVAFRGLSIQNDKTRTPSDRSCGKTALASVSKNTQVRNEILGWPENLENSRFFLGSLDTPEYFECVQQL